MFGAGDTGPRVHFGRSSPQRCVGHRELPVTGATRWGCRGGGVTFGIIEANSPDWIKKGWLVRET